MLSYVVIKMLFNCVDCEVNLALNPGDFGLVGYAIQLITSRYLNCEISSKCLVIMLIMNLVISIIHWITGAQSMKIINFQMFNIGDVPVQEVLELTFSHIMLNKRFLPIDHHNVSYLDVEVLFESLEVRNGNLFAILVGEV